jgi:hypothetical protein
MGPPRERDGVTSATSLSGADPLLQWGRRANATDLSLRAPHKTPLP